MKFGEFVIQNADPCWKGFTNGPWQPGGIQFGAFDQENQINQVLHPSVFPAHARQSVGMRFLGELFFR